ncbi:thiamine ABC transporter ATP-binding protein [Veronia nyctiphanis]|uniref:Thiamine ABC transporter ATP-binding protein n=1 Tax=Veronia nyctiphanis TaxID=1278244 RepID=A0A4Q0YT37_9GAMM|nr:thiamine ABC transporter ATP-binding protein [Veronia nyctiphanis]RXJ73314.1 thiamine ABC transporter ATP-binding protein [Veronia nyctiphanis]
MLHVNNLTHHYHSTTLSFSFSADQGSITAILGASGAGKSTLLTLLCGLLDPDDGKAEMDGVDFTNKAAHERPLSILFQEHNLFSHLKVEQNIAIGISPSLKLNDTQKMGVFDAAKSVGLAEYLGRLPDELSGGQKQRVALARCIVRRKPLLLLDEPFSALDPALRKEMLLLVKNMAEEQNITVLMVTHHPEDARLIADRLLFVDDGQVIYKGDLSVLDSPTPELKFYLNHK